MCGSPTCYLSAQLGGGQVLSLCQPQPGAGPQSSQSSPDGTETGSRRGCWRSVLGLLRGAWQCPLWEDGLLRQPVLCWSLQCRQGAPVAAGPTRWRAPSRCPAGDHLVDGLFSHGCESGGMEEEGFVGAIQRELHSRERGFVVHSVSPAPARLWNLLLGGMAGSPFPFLRQRPSLCLRTQRHTVGASASLPGLPRETNLGAAAQPAQAPCSWGEGGEQTSRVPGPVPL